MNDSTKQPQAPNHLNSTGCTIRCTPGKGRGVYAAREIPTQTVVEISPVLLFNQQEYTEHGRHTLLDHYTFVWKDGRMALALGLGSLFNHASAPNVSYTLDTTTESIRYTTSRSIQPGEELCIFYGHKLWFEPVDGGAAVVNTGDEVLNAKDEALKAEHEALADDGFGSLAGLAVEENDMGVKDEDVLGPCPYDEGDPEEILEDEDLPFNWMKPPPDEEEPGSVRTIRAWVVDIPDPRRTGRALKWLKDSKLESASEATLGHLKRIRKHGPISALLLTAGPDAPTIPADLELSAPYAVSVPANAALTLPSLALKTALWPTNYTPRKKDAPERWTRGRVRGAWEAMRYAVRGAREAKGEGELPIFAHIPAVEGETPAFSARDTRHRTSHPLRHAVIDVIRQVAEYRAEAPSSASAGTIDIPATTTELEAKDEQTNATNHTPEIKNGQDYLLTGLTLFITHEPCIMCSMALLHSRVKEVIYLLPMPATGGCGGAACLPWLQGVNHRFRIGRWKVRGEAEGERGAEVLKVDEGLDV